MRTAKQVILGISFMLAATGLSEAQNPFTPACNSPHFPVPAPSVVHEVDSQCGLTGSGGREAAQNTAKNNFCALGQPQTMTIDTLQELQRSVEQNTNINFGDEATAERKAGPTQNRAPLRQLGEGKLAVLTGYVLIARQEGKESVNCGTKVANDPLNHDIHISIVSAPDVTNECQSVVAEMSPHHRPDSWTAQNVNKVAHAKALVRVTGQLFFDSSHAVCENGQRVRSNPSRVSLWEIHPIYGFEVCTAKCSTNPTWTPIHVWLQHH